MKKCVLALDLATTTGWALHKEGMERPFFGSKKLKVAGQSNGVAGESLRLLLSDQHAMHGITDVVFEAQHINHNVTPETAILLLGLGFMTEWVAHMIGARCFLVDISTWRKTFCGKGNLSKDEARKRSLDRCRALGWHVGNHDEAAACGVLDHYVRLLNAKTGYPVPWRDHDFMQGVRY